MEQHLRLICIPRPPGVRSRQLRGPGRRQVIIGVSHLKQKWINIHYIRSFLLPNTFLVMLAFLVYWKKNNMTLLQLFQEYTAFMKLEKVKTQVSLEGLRSFLRHIHIRSA